MPFDKQTLTRRMDEKGINQTDLAGLLGVTSQAVNQWCAPDGTSPSGQNLQRLAAALDVTEAYFFTTSAPSARRRPKRSGGGSPQGAQIGSKLLNQHEEAAFLDLWRNQHPEIREAMLVAMRAIAGVAKAAIRVREQNNVGPKGGAGAPGS